MIAILIMLVIFAVCFMIVDYRDTSDPYRYSDRKRYLQDRRDYSKDYMNNPVVNKLKDFDKK